METEVKTEKLVRLPEIVEPRGTGIPDLKAKLIERTREKAIYLRSDDVYEVFRVQITPSGEMFGRWYPERETYPCNEDFGKTAWTFRTLERARDKYGKI